MPPTKAAKVQSITFEYYTVLYCTVLYSTVLVQYCTVQYLYSTVQYSTVVDRHGDQGRHVLRHVRGGQNRGSTLSGGEFKLAFMGSKVYS